MRDISKYPLTDEEIIRWLDRKLAEAIASGSFGSLEPLIIQTIKKRLGEHSNLLKD